MEINVKKGENIKIYRDVILKDTQLGDNCILADDSYVSFQNWRID